jgi:hypothetical protein
MVKLNRYARNLTPTTTSICDSDSFEFNIFRFAVKVLRFGFAKEYRTVLESRKAQTRPRFFSPPQFQRRCTISKSLTKFLLMYG